MMKKKILFIYQHNKYPTRPTIWEYINSFKKYNKELIYPVNIYFSRISWFLKKIDFDIVILHQSIAATSNKKRLFKNIKYLKKIDFKNAIKVCFFQDEFYNNNLMCDLINSLEIKYVFSVSPESEWRKIYYNVNFKEVKFFRVLTGYVDEKSIDKIDRIRDKIKRDIDIGYRTFWNNPFRLGKFGFLKKEIADKFLNFSGFKKFKLDISTKTEDMFTGFQWYKFLLRCKYFIGVESGSSLLDIDGKIKENINRYVFDNPMADFEEVKENCFKEKEGNVLINALSPRHLEAVITKTCQILMEGDYNGVLKPGIHYIELKRDYSNLNDIENIIKKDNLREKIVENAYKDIVLSGKYSYTTFIENLINRIELINKKRKITKYNILIYNWMKFYDIINWIYAFIFSHSVLKIYSLIVKIKRRKI